jgi:hypothetical protein
LKVLAELSISQLILLSLENDRGVLHLAAKRANASPYLVDRSKESSSSSRAHAFEKIVVDISIHRSVDLESLGFFPEMQIVAAGSSVKQSHARKSSWTP